MQIDMRDHMFSLKGGGCMSHALGKENIFIFYIPQPNEQWTWQGHVEKQIPDATCFDDRWLHRIART